VLSVDDRGHPALLLGFGDDVEGKGGFTGRLRPVDFDDTAARNAADAQGGSSAMLPVGIPSMCIGLVSPGFIFMMEPLPNWRSIWAIARSTALPRSVRSSAMRDCLSWRLWRAWCNGASALCHDALRIVRSMVAAVNMP
jgi:hypothetical protein